MDGGLPATLEVTDILQGWPVAYREAHILLEELADATLDGAHQQYMVAMPKVPLLIIDDLGMRKLPHTAAEDLLELIMRPHERTSTVLTSNRPGPGLGEAARRHGRGDRPARPPAAPRPAPSPPQTYGVLFLEDTRSGWPTSAFRTSDSARRDHG